MKLSRLLVTGLLLMLCLPVAQAKSKYPPPATLTPEQLALVQKAVAQERITVKEVRTLSPLVQTYIQNLKPDQDRNPAPNSDQYFLGRLDFSEVVAARSYAVRRGGKPLEGSAKLLAGLTKAFQMQYMFVGFVNMMFLDPVSFNQKNYSFSYVRRDFLGEVRTTVFDVQPKPRTGPGRFTGRIWVEDQGGNIVRFNGAFTAGGQDDNRSGSFHFDSWRENLQPGLWLPVGIYVEGKQGSRNSFKAQTYIWGYSRKLPAHESDNESVRIDDVQDQSDSDLDLSPLQAQRQWVSMAEENVLDRLEQAGLLAPPGNFEKVLEQITNNLIISSSLPLPDVIHCRILLTAPLESSAVGNTIILSKGLIDVLPSEADMAAMLAFQLAHIMLGHHIDTRWAFNDRLVFTDEESLARIQLTHTNADNELAAREAIEVLSRSVYASQLSQPGQFLLQVTERSKQLQSLVTPRLGDSLLRPDGEPWLNALMPKDRALETRQANQAGALPLESRLKTDAWDDEVVNREHPSLPGLNASEAAPLEIRPVFFRLARYEPGPGKTAEPGHEKQLVHILFATDRAPAKPTGNIQTFTGDRAANDDLVFGSADVSIPPGHTTGVVETPSWFHFRVTFDTNKDVVLTEVRALPANQFLASLDQEIRTDPKREALVFIHGYDVTFEDAARRLGQITYDLGFPGAPILYSWPSKGSLLSYVEDEGNVEWSSSHFLKFLKMLNQDKEIETVYVIAHSMGNRLVTSAFKSLSQEGEQANAKFSDIVMAAPDVDVGVFSQMANSMHRVAPHVTIYESSKDLALTASHQFHGYPRLGDTDPNVHVFANYECIEATSVDTSLLGHSYIGDNPSILADVYDLIMSQAPASRRFRLQERSINGLPYWAFKK
jgi:esterase/lipase superfamily enzyme